MAKRKSKKIKKIKSDFAIWDFCASIITGTDEVLDEVEEILEDGKEAIWNIAGSAVIGYDKFADIVAWFFWKTFILFARRMHDGRVNMLKYRKEILKHAGIVFIVLLGLVGVFASTIDYEYSYNGRTLGIVKEQRDVLEILDLISAELSHEYGSNISIDAETDITFKPVISIGKEIDDADTVLRRFTYMGDIQAQAFALVVDGRHIAVVESQAIAEESRIFM